ncbi:MAG: 23S rRNA (cytidine(2498)-2'-O)-methyltransferase RlmM [Betaproteobacteria bacterium]|nr:23S rRNA (cytidine(2498)-2'-O)-methyltransferase RlmM [Betaproteobacteria bacterium]
MRDSHLPAYLIVAHCRAGFEPEAATDLGLLGEAAGARIDVDAPVGRGFVVGNLAHFDPRPWPRAFERAPPVFVRSLFFGTGPHALFNPASAAGRPDRVAPLVELIERFCAAFPLRDLAACEPGPANGISLRLETPDTNDGKALSGLARALAARLAGGLQERGVMRAVGDDVASAPDTHLHVLLPGGAHAYVGASISPWASRWTMGIPRLRMPGGAPSRSTLKLAEAFVTFLGDREPELLRAGMRAVDLGAAPGGWTWQLARRDLRVIAVDNGPLKGVVATDPLVTHLRADGLSYLPKHPVDWMVCDIVEQPSRIAALVARWLGEGYARHCVFNLKLPMKRRHDEVRRCAATIREALAKAGVKHTLALRQLYHDREEVTGFCTTTGAPPCTPRGARRPRRSQASPGMMPRRR